MRCAIQNENSRVIRLSALSTTVDTEDAEVTT
jgi:hypothetical protein